MIDCFHFSEKELTRLGIVFLSSDEAKSFIDYIMQRLDTIIGEELIKKLQTEDDHYDNIRTATRAINERNNTDKERPDYQMIVERAQIDLIWNVFLHRDELDRVTINHEVDRAEITLREVGVPTLVCSFFNAEGISSIGDVLKSSKLSFYENNAPEMYYELKRSILNFLFPDPPQQRTTDTVKSTARSQRIDDVFYKHNHKSPYEVLEELKNYIQSQAYAYCNGECTLNEFIIHTYSPFVAMRLINSISNNSFRSAEGFEDNILKCYYGWKNLGIIDIDDKIKEHFPQTDDLSKTIEWLFYIIDTLLIPIESFFPLSYFCDLKDQDYPNVITAIHDTTERFTLTEECLDFDKLLNDPAPENKTFTLFFADETTATLTVRKIGSTFYRCYGIIDGYMSKEGEIEIEADSNGYWFYFDKKEFPEIDMVLMTTDHPIPHPKWSKYNSAVNLRKKIIKEKYDEKRNNYIKGLTQ